MSQLICDFDWEPIDSNKNEIRLLLLEADMDVRAWPRAKLIKQSLDHPAYYEAISYAWTGSQSSMPLFLTQNGQVFDVPVTADLCTALQRLRHLTEDRCFWVDAICVSQRDTVEKERQIGLIHKIFYNAKLVHVWLDQSMETQPMVIDRLNKTGNPMTTADKVYWASSEARTDLASLGACRYFGRLWIVGEMILARSIRIHCSWASVTIERFQQAIHIISDMRNGSDMWDRSRLLHKAGHSAYLSQPLPEWVTLLLTTQKVLSSAMRYTAAEKETLLLGVLQDTRRCAVSDPRDRVNAFLPLYNAFFGASEVADYRSPTATRFTNFARSWMLQNKSLRILTLANSFHSTMINLPSTAPDWTSFYNHRPQMHDLALWDVFPKHEKINEAQKRSNHILEDAKQWTSSAVFLSAHILAEVEITGAVWYEDSPTGSMLPTTDTLKQWLNMVAEARIFNEVSCSPFRFIRTILRDVYPSSMQSASPLSASSITPAQPIRLDHSRIKHLFSQDIVWPFENLAEILALHFPGYAGTLVDKVFFLCNPSVDRPGAPWVPGLGPRHMRKGDRIVFFRSGNLPFVIRPIGPPTEHPANIYKAVYKLVGPCYVDVFADGLESEAQEFENTIEIC